MVELKSELARINAQKQECVDKTVLLEKQLADVEEATIDEEGLRRFCMLAAENLDTLDDQAWRVLLENVKLTALIDDAGIKINVAIPTRKDPVTVIANDSSPPSRRTRRR